MQQIHSNLPYSIAKAKNEHRSRIEFLYSRVGLLSGMDKVLMTMYLKNGNTFYQMSKLSGFSETTISRRINRISKRLTNGDYIVCLRNRDKFTGWELKVANDYFLKGFSIRKIAAKHHRTYYRVRETILKIREVIEETNNSKTKAHTPVDNS